MKVTKKVLTLAILGVGLLAGVTVLAMWLADGSGTPAHAQAPVTIGFDMDPNDGGAVPTNTCPGNGTDDCVLGTIDPCVEVPSGGGDITFDIYLDGLPSDTQYGADLTAWRVVLGEKTGQALGTVTALTSTNAAINLLAQAAGSGVPSYFDVSALGALPGAAQGNIVDLGTAEANPPFTKGVLSRVAATITAADGVYYLTVLSPLLINTPSSSYCDTNYYEPGCVFKDGNTLPTPYGAIAVGEACPTYADVEIVSQEVRAENCIDPAPTEMDADTDTVLCLHKTIVNNGTETPVDVSIDPDLIFDLGPGNCDITEDVTNPHTYDDLGAVEVTVDEKFTVNCDEPSTHDFVFSNDVVPTAPVGVVDPDDTNNTNIETDFSIDVIAEADVSIDSQAFVTPPTEIIVGVDTTVTLRKQLINDGPYGPVNVTVTTTRDLPPAEPCTATLDDQNPDNPVTLALPLSVDVAVDEDWIVNCGAGETAVTFTFHNSITIETAHVEDAAPGGDTTADTDLTVDVVPLVGSVDCDDQFTPQDAGMVLAYWAGLRTGSSQCPLVGQTLYLPAADADGDTNVDVLDAWYILRCWAGFVVPFAWCPNTP